MNQDTQAFIKNLLNAIELEDITIKNLAYQLIKDPVESSIQIGISNKTTEVDISDNIMSILHFFSIKIEQDEIILDFLVDYRLTFIVKDIISLNTSLEDEETKKFFLEYQVPKFAYSFLREDFHTACSKVGLRPITLKMMR